MFSPLSLVLVLLLSLSLPEHAFANPNPKVQTDCERVRDTYDWGSLNIIFDSPAPTENQVKAMGEVNAKGVGTNILIMRCDLLDAKKWASIKSDYIKVIEKANQELKRIVKKYGLAKTISLTCIKNGVKKDVSGIKPACPKGFKELYRR